MTTQQVGGSEASPGGENAIDGAQQALDSQQEGLPAAEPQTPADPAVAALTAQVRGLQGVVDRTQAELLDLRNQNQTADWKQRIDALPEDQRALGEMVSTLAAQVAQPSANGVQAPAQRGTDEERDFVRGLGVDPDNPGVAYGYLGTPGGTGVFLDSIQRVRGWIDPGAQPQTIVAPAAPTPVPQVAQPITGTPPLTPTGNSRAAIETAYLEGQYEGDPDGAMARFTRELSAIGQSP